MESTVRGRPLPNLLPLRREPLDLPSVPTGPVTEQTEGRRVIGRRRGRRGTGSEVDSEKVPYSGSLHFGPRLDPFLSSDTPSPPSPDVPPVQVETSKSWSDPDTEFRSIDPCYFSSLSPIPIRSLVRGRTVSNSFPHTLCRSPPSPPSGPQGFPFLHRLVSTQEDTSQHYKLFSSTTLKEGSILDGGWRRGKRCNDSGRDG